MISHYGNNRSLGTLGEEAAVEYLQQQGYHIRQVNFRVSKMGEIDIIAEDNSYISFIEVKTRTNDLFGVPSEAITSQKRDTIRRLAAVYLKRHGLSEAHVRMDVVEVMARREKEKISIKSVKLIKDAFE